MDTGKGRVEAALVLGVPRRRVMAIEFGGGGRPPIDRLIIGEELIAAGAPIAAMWFADRQMGPTLIAYGTPDQQETHLRSTLTTEHVWCQLFSEPGAGSDLAGIKSRAERDGNDWILNGSKTYISNGINGGAFVVAARTVPDRRHGIGLFVVEALSVIIQVLYFKQTGKRVFLMAPIHHHFEKLGWAEPQIVIRFWIIASILALAGLAISAGWPMFLLTIGLLVPGFWRLGDRARLHGVDLGEGDAEADASVPHHWVELVQLVGSPRQLLDVRPDDAREERPELRQVVFRPGTVVGPDVHSPVTDLFEKPVVLGIVGSDSPFVFIWDQDLVACLVDAVFSDKVGVYNQAGDGALTPREIAKLINKPYLPLPASLVKSALWALKSLGLTENGPERVKFLRYRPVLSNRRLKEEYGYTPQLSSREAFEHPRQLLFSVDRPGVERARHVGARRGAQRAREQQLVQTELDVARSGTPCPSTSPAGCACSLRCLESDRGQAVVEGVAVEDPRERAREDRAHAECDEHDHEGHDHGPQGAEGDDHSDHIH